MISWINSWAQGIIIAVIIATVIEMILPEGNNKKYIKTVIGIYIIFNIIYPLVTKISGKSLDLNIIINREEYIDVSYMDVGERLLINTNEHITGEYIERIKNDIKVRLEDKGYIVNKVNMQIETEDDNRYGEINKIELNIYDKKKQSKENESKETNTVSEVEKIDINISKSNNDTNVEIEENINRISEESINEIKSFLETIYGVNKENVYINI